MDHVKALFIKLAMIAVVLGIVLTGIFDGEFKDTMLISLVLTVVAYLIGDLFIFRKSSNDRDQNIRNMIATISDAVLAFLVILLMGQALFTNGRDVIIASLISALVIAAGEWFFHKYLDKHVFHEKPYNGKITYNS